MALPDDGASIAAALCVPVPFVLRYVTSREHAELLLEVAASGQELQRLVEHFAATTAQADALRAAFAHALAASRVQSLLTATLPLLAAALDAATAARATLLRRLRALDASLRACEPRLVFTAAVCADSAGDFAAHGLLGVAASRRAVGGIAAELARRLRALCLEGGDADAMPPLAHLAQRLADEADAAARPPDTSSGPPLPAPSPTSAGGGVGGGGDDDDDDESGGGGDGRGAKRGRSASGDAGGSAGKRPREDDAGGPRLTQAVAAVAAALAHAVAPQAEPLAPPPGADMSQRSVLGSVSPGRGGAGGGLFTPAPAPGSGGGSGVAGAAAAALTGAPPTDAGGAGRQVPFSVPPVPYIFSAAPSTAQPQRPEGETPSTLPLGQRARLFDSPGALAAAAALLDEAAPAPDDASAEDAGDAATPPDALPSARAAGAALGATPAGVWTGGPTPASVGGFTGLGGPYGDSPRRSSATPSQPPLQPRNSGEQDGEQDGGAGGTQPVETQQCAAGAQNVAPPPHAAVPTPSGSLPASCSAGWASGGASQERLLEAA